MSNELPPQYIREAEAIIYGPIGLGIAKPQEIDDIMFDLQSDEQRAIEDEVKQKIRNMERVVCAIEETLEQDALGKRGSYRQNIGTGEDSQPITLRVTDRTREIVLKMINFQYDYLGYDWSGMGELR